jgi:uncharacterized spore protein YtfJ
MVDASEGRGLTDGQPTTLDQDTLTAFGKAAGLASISQAMAAVARPDAAVGPITTNGAYTVIPLVETVFAGGYGLGFGSGRNPRGAESEPPGQGTGGGAGGGGGASSRTIAIAVMGPNGVEVRPVVDVAKLGIAALGAAAALAAMLARRKR